MTPQARGYFIPVLAENDGCEIIISTPRGENHFYDLYNNVKDDEQWYTSHLTVDDTIDGDGNPVVDKKDIDFYRKSGWSNDKINQEMYCSFTASTDGAYFADQMKEALDSDRICDFGIDTSIPVSTYWDLGISKDDAMSIWLVQKKHDNFYCIAYHEDHNHGISHYINWLRDFRDRNGIVFDQHFGPHDIVNRHHSTGKSTKDIAMELGFVFRRVPRVQKKEVAIDLARMVIPRCYFHKTKASQGIACLRDYHKKYDEEKRIYRHVHNWASHGADAFMTLAQSQNEKTNNSMNISTLNVLDGFG
jgi:hypothetical protein